MKSTRLVFTICTCFLITVLLLFPQQMLLAAAKSIDLWFRFVLPSLFPFMAAVGILIRLGAAHTMGLALHPIMKPLFGLRGVCAFPFLLGLISGYPVGAKITVTLYEEGVLTKEEAQHILSFSNNPGPLFVIGTVGTALLKNPMWGYFMMLCIFLSAITTGILFRFGCKAKENKKNNLPIIRKKDVPSFGIVLEQSIADAMETILQIGGFILFFGVLIEAFVVTGIFSMVTQCLSFLIPLPQPLLSAILSGILEMTNGAALLSHADCSMLCRLISITAVLSFGGLSILGQTLGIIGKIPVSPKIYLFSKILNALFASFYIILLYPTFKKGVQKAVPAIHFISGTASPYTFYFILCILFFFMVFAWGIYTTQKRN